METKSKGTGSKTINTPIRLGEAERNKADKDAATLGLSRSAWLRFLINAVDPRKIELNLTIKNK